MSTFLVKGQQVKHYSDDVEHEEEAIKLTDEWWLILYRVMMVNQELHERKPVVWYFKAWLF